MQRYVVIEKQIGETPLQAIEAWRAAQPPAYQGVPLTYAGRLDPMASGKLLVLIGEECKRKDSYLALDKQYQFSILFGASSDTGDILGLISAPPPTSSKKDLELDVRSMKAICTQLHDRITLPYPHFSSKAVHGKPLHTWTLEGRLDEITIPTKTSTIYKLRCTRFEAMPTEKLFTQANATIATLPPVTDPRKSIGNDFRRTDVLASWQRLRDTYPHQVWQIGHFTCTASSGTYMRTLAEVIAKRAGTSGLAWSIHRTDIGYYQPLPFGTGIWRKRY